MYVDPQALVAAAMELESAATRLRGIVSTAQPTLRVLPADPKKCPVARPIISTPSRAALPRPPIGQSRSSPLLRPLCARTQLPTNSKTSSQRPAWPPHRSDRQKSNAAPSSATQQSHFLGKNNGRHHRRHLVSTGRSTQLRSTGRRGRAGPSRRGGRGLVHGFVRTDRHRSVHLSRDGGPSHRVVRRSRGCRTEQVRTVPGMGCRCRAARGETAGKAQVQSGSYTVATLAMPSLAEIAAVQAAKVAAYSVGGALVGGAAAAEAAEEALKIRAAVTMETYDAATAHLAVQQNFDSPPSIAEPTAGASASAQSPGRAAQQSVVQTASTLADVVADPVRAATAAVASVVSNPAFAAAASQAGAISGGASAAVSATTTAVTSATTAASALATAGAGLTRLGGAGHGGARLGASTPSLFGTPSASRAPAQVSAASATTGAGAIASSSSSSSTGRHALPDPSTGQSAARHNPVTSPIQGTADTVKVDPAEPLADLRRSPAAVIRSSLKTRPSTTHPIT